jgi:transposase
MSTVGRLLTPAEVVPSPWKPFLPAVATIRGAFTPPGYELMDELFCGLLARSSTDAAGDAAKLASEHAQDPLLAQALHDEYVAAYSAAVAAVHQSDTRTPAPRHAWAAATPEQAVTVTALALVLRNHVTSRPPFVQAARWIRLAPAGAGVPLSIQTASAKSEIHEIRLAVWTGLYLAIDHDVVWNHDERLNLEGLIRRKLKLSGESVGALVRRHRSARPSLGIHSAASRQNRKAWLNDVRRSLWFDRLRPLHPPMLTEGMIDEANRILGAARVRVIAPAPSPRKSRPCPSQRSEVDWLLNDAMWGLVLPVMPNTRSRSKPAREVLLGALVVLSTGIGWTHLPKELGLGSGAMVLRHVTGWRESGVWSQIQALLEQHLPGVEWSRP